jgi:non-ribosomal peptide synthetase component E (peptide arylation enzyme)
MISMLCAQEAERGIAARAWENKAIRDLLAASAGRYGERFAEAAAGVDTDLSLAAMDRANASLRTALIDLHIAVEDARDGSLDTQIRALYVKMADARRLDLPPMPAS